MGFKVTGSSSLDKKNCYCPCSRHMEPWRAQFFLNSIAGKGSHAYCETSKGSRNMFPMSLFAHLKDGKFNMCPVHYEIKSYVRTLYPEYIRTSGKINDYSMGNVH